MPRSTTRTPESHLPLRPLELLVLAMLTDADRHGYAIRQAILEHTSNAIEVEAGNLYRHIRRLDQSGLIEESGRRPAADVDDERRRYFRMTPMGRRVWAAELLRLRALVRYAEEHAVIAPARS